jgi:hypothetical protein
MRRILLAVPSLLVCLAGTARPECAGYNPPPPPPPTTTLGPQPAPSAAPPTPTPGGLQEPGYGPQGSRTGGPDTGGAPTATDPRGAGGPDGTGRRAASSRDRGHWSYWWTLNRDLLVDRDASEALRADVENGRTARIEGAASVVLGRIGGREASRLLASVILDPRHPTLARHK